MLRRCCHHSAARPVPERAFHPLIQQAVFLVAAEVFLPAEPSVQPCQECGMKVKSLDFLST